MNQQIGSSYQSYLKTASSKKGVSQGHLFPYYNEASGNSENFIEVHKQIQHSHPLSAHARPQYIQNSKDLSSITNSRKGNRFSIRKPQSGEIVYRRAQKLVMAQPSEPTVDVGSGDLQRDEDEQPAIERQIQEMPANEEDQEEAQQATKSEVDNLLKNSASDDRPP